MRAHVRRRWHKTLFLVAGACVLGRAQNGSDRSTDGSSLFALGDFAAAERAFTRELEAAPGQPALLFNRASARFNLREYAAAKRDLDACLRLQPRSPQALVFRAQIHLLLGEFRAAATDADTVLELDPHDVDTLALRARARTALGRFELALRDFNQVLQRQPRHAVALIGRGDLHLAREDLPAALADFSLAARNTPDDPDAQFKLGLLYFRLLDLPAAGRSAELVMRLTGGGAPAEKMLGLVHYAAGDLAAAAQAFRRAAAADDAGTYYTRLLLSLCERRLGRPASPIPEPPAALPNRVWVQMLRGFLLGEVTEDELFLGAQNLVPPEARPGRLCEASFYLGTVRLHEGDREAALYYFQQAAAQSTPAFAEHTLARAELSRLKPPPAPPPPRNRRG